MKYAEASQNRFESAPKDEAIGEERVAIMEESTSIATRADEQARAFIRWAIELPWQNSQRRCCKGATEMSEGKIWTRNF